MDDKEYLEMALEEADKSDCNKIHFGSVIVRDDFILGRGHNHTFIEGDHDCLKPSNYQLGSNPSLCYAVHSEWDALVKALRDYSREVVDGAKIYVVGQFPEHQNLRLSNWFICTVCSRLLKLAGIREVVSYNEKGDIVHQTLGQAMSNSYDQLKRKGGGRRI